MKLNNSLSLVFLRVMIVSVLVLSPFYIYDSGAPQPAHFIIILSVFAIIFLNFKNFIAMLKCNWYILAFFVFATCVNSFYFIRHSNSEFLVNLIYWLYGFLFFLGLRIAPLRLVSRGFFGGLVLFVFSLIFLAYIFGYGGYSFWPRYQFYFNGPNQLAYFAICVFLAYLAHCSDGVNWRFISIFMLFLFAVLASGGRSAYLALLPILFILIWKFYSNFLAILKLIVCFLIVIVVFIKFNLPLVAPFECLHNRAECSETGATTLLDDSSIRISQLNFDKQSDKNDSIFLQLEARGYMRLIDFPKYLIFGAGQGFDSRFGDVNGHVYEIHSSIFAVLFYYGFFGFLLFCMMIWKSFENKYDIVLIAPIFVYGFFTYGLRSPYFWFALGVISISQSYLSRRGD